MTDMKVEITVQATPFIGDETYTENMTRFMVLCGAELDALLTYESAQRSDGLGNPDGAIDTGELAGGWLVKEEDEEHVVVGTNVPYAYGLATGEPDPSASLQMIREWRERKNVPRRAKQVWDKITTEGPTPNPFHERAMDDFLLRVPDLIREAWE